MKKLLLIIILFFVAKISPAQHNNFFTWSGLQLIAKINPTWHWVTDGSYRTIGISAYANQYSFRTGIKKIINNKWSVAAGVAIFKSRLSINKDVHEFNNEYRIYQEALLENTLNKKLLLSNRFRTEERFFDATSKAASYNALRLRYRIALTQNIHKNIKVQIANEYMRQIAKGKFLFQQNRLSSSCIFALNKTTQLQTSYMWDKVPTTSQHYIIFILQKTISFKK